MERNAAVSPVLLLALQKIPFLLLLLEMRKNERTAVPFRIVGFVKETLNLSHICCAAFKRVVTSAGNPAKTFSTDSLLANTASFALPVDSSST